MRLDRRHGYGAGVDWEAIKATAVIDEKDSRLRARIAVRAASAPITWPSMRLSLSSFRIARATYGTFEVNHNRGLLLHPIDNIAKHFGKNEVAFEH